MFSVTMEDDDKKVIFDATLEGPVRSEFDKVENKFAMFQEPVAIHVLMYELGQATGEFVAKKT